MQLVDRNRSGRHVVGGAMGLPLLVPPRIGIEIDHDRGRVWSQFGSESERVGLLDPARTHRRMDGIFVHRADPYMWDEPAPDAGVAVGFEPIFARGPAVEVADHTDRTGTRRPHGKLHSGDAGTSREMRPELFIRPSVGPLSEQVQVKIR